MTGKEIAIHGEIGVLAYDELADRIQCHACGRWFHKLTSFHLKRHDLSIPAYKERFGLNVTTALETPRIGNLRRQHNERTGVARHLIHRPKGAPPPGGPHPNIRRAEYLRHHATPAARERRAQAHRSWTDAQMLAVLRQVQAERGGILRLRDLRDNRPGGRGVLPSDRTVIARFGSWRRVCELLGQPYRTTRPRPAPGAARRWSDAELLDILRSLQAQHGGVLRSTVLLNQPRGRKGKAGALPSYKTVIDRFGSWQRVCDLLGQPYRARGRAGHPAPLRRAS